MTRKQFDILFSMIEQTGTMTQRELAQMIGMSVGTVNKVIHELLELGWIDGTRITMSGLEAMEQYKVKRAVLLAAGFGSRLVPITFNTPKPLVRVNGVRIIDTLLDAVTAAGIPEIIIVRGYLGEQFDQLLYKYPNIRFVENPSYNESNNISSAVCVRYLLQNAYVLESDLLLKNPSLIRKYEYSSNYLGFSVNVTDDWCFHTNTDGFITDTLVGSRDCYQMVGISYWSEQDGAKLAADLDEVYKSPGGKERFWDQVPLVYKRDHYRVRVRECLPGDVIEIDTFNELKRVDPLYAG